MFLFIFQKVISKKLRRFPIIDQGNVILPNLNIDDSDSRSDGSSPNDSIEESQCMENKIIWKALTQNNKILRMNRIIKQQK